ncbi:branched-chain amino acid transport system permease protein [Microbacterium terrae]|uniref:High-affinity branched-chain amino acid transport system permease protein LivH n=1 Tax=Microbacterium terrae TaxID=69369 RepID=A0A0M2H3S9_9MICO|nr:branched-chain amino acid ABC transporter permease [Microbacterium terrae]KJL40938.1 High-affinity branched-chain amino acid transport system permease protein LivH [Microbacterium terrae]MBP1078227.1 branched-chain amino acid transport system permease protein [Microbacterium terrae]
MAAAMLLFATPLGAHADATAPDEPGADQTATDYYFSGLISYQDEPVADVTVSIEGGGFEAETITNAEGRWRLYVPEKDAYTLTVDETTLPDGVIVDPEQLPEGIAPKDGTTASFEVEFGLTDSRVLNLFLGQGERVTTSFVDQLVERLVNGLNFGLLLALAAVGVSLIFGTTGLTNFAHAEMLTFGAIVALVFGGNFGLPMWLVVPIVVLFGAAFGWSLDAGLWRPLRRRGLGLVQLMIVSIGLSLAIRYLYAFFIGGGTYQLPGAGAPRDIRFGPVSMSWIDAVSMGTSIVLLLAVAYWLLRTRVGKATRAISDNPGLAAASGINVDRVIRTVWILSASLAAVAGVLWAYFRPGVKWDMGVQVLLLIFAAVTLGGLGTAFGALVGSLIVGILVEISTLWIPPDMKYVGALAVLIVILLVRPQGLLGRKERLG